MPPVKKSRKTTPYVGIIQIRLSVEGFTFLSACITQAPAHLVNDCIVRLFERNCKKKIISIESNL